MEKRDEANLQKLEERIWKIVEVVSDFPDHVKKAKGPGWLAWYVMEIVKAALGSLRHYLEEPSEQEISWQEPIMEARWRVEWDWEHDQPAFGGLTAEDAELEGEALVQRILSISWETLFATTLQFLTKYAYFKKRNAQFVPHLPWEILHHLDSLTPSEQQSLVDAIFRPYTFFGNRSDPNHANWSVDLDGGNTRLSRDTPASLAFRATSDDGGTTLASGYVLTQFRPLVVDEEAHDAYFPATVAVIFDNGQVTPEQWAEVAFWDQILSTLDDEIGRVTQGVETDRNLDVTSEIKEAFKEGRVITVPSVPAQQRLLVEHVRAYSFLASGHVGLNKTIAGLPHPRVIFDTTAAEASRSSRKQRPGQFPSPRDLRWDEIRIQFISDTAARISAREVSRVYNFGELGFTDRRTADSPDTLWGALLAFATRNGEVSWNDAPANPKRFKPYVKELRKRLRAIFGIDGDPFEDYRKAKAYRTKFVIRKSN
jgi:hypothetical protein